MTLHGADSDVRTFIRFQLHDAKQNRLKKRKKKSGTKLTAHALKDQNRQKVYKQTFVYNLLCVLIFQADCNER